MSNRHVPTLKAVRAGFKNFQSHESRDAIYVTASFLVEHFWQTPRELANGLGALLLTWNQAHFRYGAFDYAALQECLERNHTVLTQLRGRSILDATTQDHGQIRKLFVDFLAALAIAGGGKRGARSPVATAKALHLLGPKFFPLWDRKIAEAYGCRYNAEPVEAYLLFFEHTKSIVRRLSPGINGGTQGKTALKLLDEYNYAKFTKLWV